MSAPRRLIRRSARLSALAHGVREAVRGPSGPTAPTATGASGGALPGGAREAGPDPGIAELHRIVPRRSAKSAGPRLNLLLPTLEPNRLFGGARTALELYEALASSFARRRIVTFNTPSAGALAEVPNHRLVGPDDDPETERQVVAAPRGIETSLPVEADDVFLATFWTTAELAPRLARWQASTYERPLRSFAYLVQDYEPGFYPWSVQSELARATYDGAVPTIAVVNSGLLRDYLAEQGVRFAATFTFEPRLSAGLRSLRSESPRNRRPRIVAYGRPDTPRNAFPLVVDGLRAWVGSDPTAADWTVVSAGRPHPPVDLGRGLSMRGLGKLDLPDYGALLRESAVGLSLMISPHPSYPPLEMAHLGMLVATNRFGPKDLATWHENIRSVEELTAGGVAIALQELTATFAADPAAGDRGRPLRDDFLAEGPSFPFVAALAEALLTRP